MLIKLKLMKQMLKLLGCIMLRIKKPEWLHPKYVIEMNLINKLLQE